MKKIDPILERIEVFNRAKGGGVIIERSRGGYSFFSQRNGAPIARLRPTGKDDNVEVLWWSHRDRWESVGDFGGVILPLDEALEYVASNSIFWIRA